MYKETIIYSSIDLGLNIKQISINPDTHIRELHIHNAVEIIRCDYGQVFCTVNDKNIILEENELLLINSRVMHKLSFCEKPSVITYIQIDCEKYNTNERVHLYGLSNTVTVINHKHFEPDSDLDRVFSDIQTEIDNRAPFYKSFVKSDIFRIIAIMERYRLIHDTEKIQTDKTLTKLLPALEYIDSHIDSKITLDSICHAIHIDKFYICKLFKRCLNTTFTEYVNFLRLNKAESLLLKTDESILQIAYNCGFSTVQYFNRLFKSRNGCTPKEYRNLTGK